MKKRTLKEWRRLVSEYALSQKSRRDFCPRHGLATSALDYYRRRGRGDGGERLGEVKIETGGWSAGEAVAPAVIIWPNGVRV